MSPQNQPEERGGSKPTPGKTPKERIQATKTTGLLPKWEYFKRMPDGRLLVVHCKLCGKIIYGKRMGPIISQYKDRASKTIVLEREVSYGPLGEYEIAVLEHEDGSSHETPLCATCLDSGISAAQAEAIYHADLEALHAAIRETQGEGEADTWLDAQLRKRPAQLRRRSRITEMMPEA